MFVTEDMENRLYTKEEIVVYMQENGILIEEMNAQHKYIEVQIWSDSIKDFVVGAVSMPPRLTV